MISERKRIATVAFIFLALAQMAPAQAQNLAPEAVLELVQRCAPTVHPNTMLKLLKHESGFHPFIIGVNATPRQVHRPQTQSEAARIARELIGQGKSIDMGLGQINSANLAGLKLTPEQVFEPCENVKASAQILSGGFRVANATAANERAALDQALSRYNTGNPERGITNGYVGLVRAARYEVPALDASAPAPAAPAQPAQEESPPPEWDVFARAKYRGPRPAPKAPPEDAAATSDPAAPVMMFRDNR